MNPISRFAEAYLERADKESGNELAQESVSFLEQPIAYFKQHMNEFLYLESEWFEKIGVDAVSIEVDDVFRTFDVMLGLKLPKKHQAAIKDYLQRTLRGDGTEFDLMFQQNDGLFDLNIGLNFIEGFNEEMTIGEAYQLVYHYLLQLVETVKEK